MYSNEVLNRFKNPKFAGALRGANAIGKAGSDACGDIVKIYLLVDEDGVISLAKFKAFGGVSTIVACDAVPDPVCTFIHGCRCADEVFCKVFDEACGLEKHGQ